MTIIITHKWAFNWVLNDIRYILHAKRCVCCFCSRGPFRYHQRKPFYERPPTPLPFFLGYTSFRAGVTTLPFIWQQSKNTPSHEFFLEPPCVCRMHACVQGPFCISTLSRACCNRPHPLREEDDCAKEIKSLIREKRSSLTFDFAMF